MTPQKKVKRIASIGYLDILEPYKRNSMRLNWKSTNRRAF